MAVRTHKPAVPWIFVLFTLFSFGTGFLLVSATKYNTEGRSKAFGSPTVDPYNNLLDACLYVVDGHCSTTPPVSPTKACTYTVEGRCYATSLEYNVARSRDSRCNGIIKTNCPYQPTEIPEEDLNAYRAQLPPCTVARKFMGIECRN